jgi:hypothetical protein
LRKNIEVAQRVWEERLQFGRTGIVVCHSARRTVNQKVTILGVSNSVRMQRAHSQNQELGHEESMIGAGSRYRALNEFDPPWGSEA